MKKKLTRYITMFVLALQGLTITSCSDWLDLMPNDGVPLDESGNERKMCVRY